MHRDRKQWVFFDPCGCPFGLVEALRFPEKGRPGYLTEAQAWRAFYDTRAEENDAADRGVRAVLYPHDEYERDIYPKLLSDYTCPHRTEAAA